jgi:hypothetical protein
MKIFRRNYLILLLLVLIFAAPGITAYFFYLHPAFLGETTTNKGRFINPPILLLNQKNPSKWQLVLWSPLACEKNCLAVLDKLARVRLALGRRLYELDFKLMMSSKAPRLSEALMNRLEEQDIHILKLSLEEQQRLTLSKETPEIFIVNPNHYLILSFKETVKPNDLFHDLKHLLTK